MIAHKLAERKLVRELKPEELHFVSGGTTSWESEPDETKWESEPDEPK